MALKNNHRATSLLTEAEATQFVVMASEGTDVNTLQDFESWVRGSIRSFFPHEMLIVGSVRNDFTDIGIDRLLAVDFPIAYVDAVRLGRGSFTCPTLNSWFSRGYRAQLFDPAAGQGAVVPWTPEFDRFELKNVAAHGVISPDRRTATYFSFSRVPGPLNKRHAWLLELIVPHLHRAYVRVTASANAQPGGVELSDVEATLLHWISKGKSDADIATILARSPHAIKHGVRRLISKLNAGTRHEAVAKAAWLDPIGI